MKIIVRLLLALSLISAAQADIFDWIRGTIQVEGTVGYVQSNHFVLVSPDNKHMRIFLKQGEIMPSTIVPGMIIHGTVSEGPNNNVVLESLDGVQTPTGEFVQVLAPNQ